jgi:hypothetical protein
MPLRYLEILEITDSTSQMDAPSKDAIAYKRNAMDFDFILSDAEFDFPNPFSNQKSIC